MGFLKPSWAFKQSARGIEVFLLVWQRSGELFKSLFFVLSLKDLGRVRQMNARLVFISIFCDCRFHQAALVSKDLFLINLLLGQVFRFQIKVRVVLLYLAYFLYAAVTFF